MTPDLPPGCTLDDQERAWGEPVEQDDDPYQIDEPEEETPMTTIDVVVKGDGYSAELSADGQFVEIYGPRALGSNMPLAGRGVWTGEQIVDCGADLDEKVYAELEQAIRAATATESP